MRDLCNTDKPLFAVLTKLTYSAYLNILWLVCSLPIVTIGASTTALFYVTLKMAEDRDDGLTRMFFKAFRENFKPATKLWLILLTVGSFLVADGFVLRRMWSENIFWTLLTATLIGAAVLYGIVLLYAFPLLARFENTTFGILKTAFLVGVRYLFCTLLMAAIYGIMGYVIVFVFTPAFLLGMGFCAMLCSFLMLRILYLIGGDPDAVHEEYDHDKTDRDTLRSLHGRKKWEHIWAYYKLPIAILLIVVYILGYAAYRHVTKKEDVLYLGLVNITAGSDLTEQLTTGFAEAQGLTKKQQVDLLSGLLLSESERAEEQYVYASEMKLLGAVSAQRLDVVLMDEYARDRLLADDYFLDLRTLDASFHALSGLNAGGTVLDISDTPFVRQAGFSGKVYLGVVQNAPHPERAAAYIHYLFQR